MGSFLLQPSHLCSINGYHIVNALVGKPPTINMTEGKSVGGEAPSAPYGYCTVEVLVGKWTIIDMTQGKSVGGNTPSAAYSC